MPIHLVGGHGPIGVSGRRWEVSGEVRNLFDINYVAIPFVSCTLGLMDLDCTAPAIAVRGRRDVRVAPDFGGGGADSVGAPATVANHQFAVLAPGDPVDQAPDPASK